MEMTRLVQLLNRVGGIIIWVGLWNVLDDMRNGDYYVNYLYIILGLIIWWFTGEFRLHNELQPTVQQQKDIAEIDI